MIVLAATSALLFSVGQHAATEPFVMEPAAAVEPAPSAELVAFEASLETLRDGLATAEAALGSSDGKVLDDAVRVALSDRIEQGTSTLRSGQLLTAIAAPGATPALATGADEQLASADQLQAEVAAVATAVTAWEAEQARIAAEQEAARLAAEAAARAPARIRTAGTATSAIASGPYIESIWTSGGQAEIDACRGSVNVSGIAGYLGAGFYAAEHWSCGGRAWSGLGTGSLVSFPGFGLYEVSGRVGGLVYGADASVLPGGYDGYYQTCIGGSSSNMSVWLLTRVG